MLLPGSISWSSRSWTFAESPAASACSIPLPTSESFCFEEDFFDFFSFFFFTFFSFFPFFSFLRDISPPSSSAFSSEAITISSSSPLSFTFSAIASASASSTSSLLREEGLLFFLDFLDSLLMVLFIGGLALKVLIDLVVSNCFGIFHFLENDTLMGNYETDPQLENTSQENKNNGW